MSYWHGAYQDHAPAVLAYLTSRVRRPDAEDLLQETFVRAIRASGSLRQEDKLRSYLLTIAHNLMINRLRKKSPQLFSETRSAGSDTELEDELVSDSSPEAEANLSIFEQRLAEVLDGMSPKLRIAFEQAVLRQEPYKRVARANGWTLAQVKINVFRARRQAIAHLAEFLPATTE